MKSFSAVTLLLVVTAQACSMPVSSVNLGANESVGNQPIERVGAAHGNDGNDGDIADGQIAAPVQVSGVYLTYENARISCSFFSGDDYFYQIACHARAATDSGDDVPVVGIAENISLLWSEPSLQSGKAEGLQCSVSVDGLSNLCQLRLDSSEGVASLMFGAEIQNLVTKTSRQEEAIVTLPFSVRASGGFVPHVPFAFNPDRGFSVPDYPIAFLPIPRGEDAGRPSVCYTKSSGFYGLSGVVFQFDNNSFRPFVGGVVDDLTHRLRVRLGQRVMLACSADRLFVVDANKKRILTIDTRSEKIIDVLHLSSVGLGSFSQYQYAAVAARPDNKLYLALFVNTPRDGEVNLYRFDTERNVHLVAAPASYVPEPEDSAPRILRNLGTMVDLVFSSDTLYGASVHGSLGSSVYSIKNDAEFTEIMSPDSKYNISSIAMGHKRELMVYSVNALYRRPLDSRDGGFVSMVGVGANGVVRTIPGNGGDLFVASIYKGIQVVNEASLTKTLLVKSPIGENACVSSLPAGASRIDVSGRFTVAIDGSIIYAAKHNGYSNKLHIRSIVHAEGGTRVINQLSGCDDSNTPFLLHAPRLAAGEDGIVYAMPSPNSASIYYSALSLVRLHESESSIRELSYGSAQLAHAWNLPWTMDFRRGKDGYYYTANLLVDNDGAELIDDEVVVKKEPSGFRIWRIEPETGTAELYYEYHSPNNALLTRPLSLYQTAVRFPFIFAIDAFGRIYAESHYGLIVVDKNDGVVRQITRPVIQETNSEVSFVALVVDKIGVVFAVGRNYVMYRGRENASNEWSWIPVFGQNEDRQPMCGTAISLSGEGSSEDDLDEKMQASLAVMCQGGLSNIEVIDQCLSPGGTRRLFIQQRQSAAGFDNFIEVETPCN